MKNIAHYTIRDILSLYEKKMLGAPAESCQAGNGWTENDRQLFVDSVLNGITLPAFYLYMCFTADRKFLYYVYDGKERMKALTDFYNGAFPLSKDFRLIGGNELRDKLGTDGSELAGMYYTDISVKYPYVAGAFLLGVIDCIIFDDDDIENIEESIRRCALKCGRKADADESAVNP